MIKDFTYKSKNCILLLLLNFAKYKHDFIVSSKFFTVWSAYELDGWIIEVMFEVIIKHNFYRKLLNFIYNIMYSFKCHLMFKMFCKIVKYNVHLKFLNNFRGHKQIKTI